jgi:hypothetical protein
MPVFRANSHRRDNGLSGIYMDLLGLVTTGRGIEVVAHQGTQRVQIGDRAHLEVHFPAHTFFVARVQGLEGVTRFREKSALHRLGQQIHERPTVLLRVLGGSAHFLKNHRFAFLAGEPHSPLC